MVYGAGSQRDSRAGPVTISRLDQESRPPDKSGDESGLRLSWEFSQRVGFRALISESK